MIYLTSIRNAARTVDEAANRAATAARIAHQLLGSTRAHRDPDLTTDANEKRNAETAAQIIRDARDMAGTLREETRRAADYLATTAEKHRPALTGTEGLLAIGQAWENVERRLSRGVSYRDVLASADLAETLAVEKFAADWILARTPSTPTTLPGEPYSDDSDVMRSNIERAVTERLAALAPDDVAETLTAALDVEKLAASAEPHLRRMENFGGSTISDLDAAVESALIAGRGTRPEPADDAA